MTYLTAAVVLLGIVTGLNLVLLLGVIKRLQKAEAPGVISDEGARPVLPPGERPEAFSVSSRDGELFETVGGKGRLVGFFTPHCNLCHDRMPKFLKYARAAGLERDQVFAVVVGTPDETAPLAKELSPAAHVVDEPDGGGSVYEAFGVRGLPAMYLLDADGVILSSGTDLGGFPDPQRYGAKIRSGAARTKAGAAT
ncbi:TlpA family protein disulfide reductase [Dactylosporangium sp. CS-047395]|uniref:TlpA family protein disulfide reductase n=1 Tax=Dactylosporangium sp. CS-047395 TaxID=3239936 RepID=UPI003D8DD357